MLSIEVKEAEGEVIVRVNLRLMTIHHAQDILARLKKIFSEYNKNLIVDLHNVESLDSTTISMFIELNNLLKESGKKLILANLTPFVRKTFDMLHIAKFFNIK